jgi:hypothetical protein
MMKDVIEMSALQQSPFPLVDQDMLWAFSNSSLYGILPWKFNCYPGGICHFRCEPGYDIIHGRQTEERIQASKKFGSTFFS